MHIKTTRREIFAIIKDGWSHNMENQLGILEKEFAKESHISFSIHPGEKTNLKKMMYKMRKKWRQSHRTMDIFLKNNANWLNTELIIQSQPGTSKDIESEVEPIDDEVDPIDSEVDPIESEVDPIGSEEDSEKRDSEEPVMASGKKWRESDTIKFVELYEKAECLWNFRHPAYKHRNARDRAIQQIIDEMNLPDFGANELKNKIKNIRSTYQQELNKIRRSRQGFGTDILEEYKTNLAWFPIADRFLGGVINSVKNPVPKAEEDASFYQPNQSALYNLVETEMSNGDVENEFEEKFVPFNVTIDHIKEEIDNDDYHTPSFPPQTKKRKVGQQPAYEAIEHNSRSEDTETLAYNPIVEETLKDEWYHFGNNIACQLRSLPLERALNCQKKIFDILTQERIDHIVSSKTEEKDSSNNE